MSHPNIISAMDNNDASIKYKNYIDNAINTPTHTILQNVSMDFDDSNILDFGNENDMNVYDRRDSNSSKIENDACDENSQFSDVNVNNNADNNDYIKIMKTATDVVENKNEYTNKHKTAVVSTKPFKKNPKKRPSSSLTTTTMTTTTTTEKKNKSRPNRPPNSTVIAEGSIPPQPVIKPSKKQTVFVSPLINRGGKNLNVLRNDNNNNFNNDSDDSNGSDSEDSDSTHPPPSKKTKMTSKSSKMSVTPQQQMPEILKINTADKNKVNDEKQTVKYNKKKQQSQDAGAVVVVKQQKLDNESTSQTSVNDDQQRSKDCDSPTNDLFENKIIPNMMTMERDNNRKFVQYILNAHNYLFIVYENKYNAKTFNKNSNASIYKIEYVNCVQSIYKYYNANYSHIDRTCKVVSFNRFRFAISVNLLNKMQIELPPTEQFKKEDLKKISPKNTFCLLNEVKDPDFISKLTNTFGLDNIYIQGQLTMLLSSIGENRAKILNQHISAMIEDKSLFTIPLHLSRSKELEEIVDDDLNPNNSNVSSAYIRDIIELSNKLKFKAPIIPSYVYKTKEQNIENVLSFWINTQKNNNERDKTLAKSLQFTYKFTSVARVLFDETDGDVNKLFKVKKEPGSVAMIEDYLQACEKIPNGNNFIMINTLNDERVTIIKAKNEFFWICTNNPNNLIHCIDIIMAFKNFNHHLLSLIPSNRKDLNNRHSGLIKLVAYHLGGDVDINFVRAMTEKFKCNYLYKKF
ncbi:IE-1 protein [Chrysodeixis chalcites SNPV TF1-A]|uniref:IE-1 n=1 Tax=Chrysodeixis chalcites nucleopolyhedrovirus TaxID=320432 RepID=T1QZA6_9ABAC|nr:IE-1 protein [Chrysodeixis chalcites SNPV TF1-A]AGE61427.1 IE-1 [Chrysodeixis chalcites nucleopolyhedrovirus]